MPAYTSSISLAAVEDYFAHINPIAERISYDIRDTKSTYGDLWYTLNANEQNDIINETLINPEISLKYFDKFHSISSSSSSSASSAAASSTLSSVDKSPSVDLLTEVVLKNFNNGIDMPKTQDPKRHYAKEAMHYYAYDGRHLKTYAAQKVALKTVHDDMLGAYRDEHSTPFSYKTKSQINLYNAEDGDESPAKPATALQLDHKTNTNDDKLRVLGAQRGEKINSPKFVQNYQKTLEPIANYKKLQNELKMNLSTQKTHETTTKRTTGYERLAQVNDTTYTKEELPSKAAVECKKTPKSTNSKSELVLKSFMDGKSLPAQTNNYAIYTDVYFEDGESSKLMNNCSNSSILSASSSSVTTSDDDRYDYEDDEKTLCEDVKLLDNDISLRRGFDFLNNW